MSGDNHKSLRPYFINRRYLDEIRTLNNMLAWLSGDFENTHAKKRLDCDPCRVTSRVDMHVIFSFFF